MASPEWKEALGVHAEGRVTAVQRTLVRGINIVGMAIEIVRGTVRQGRADVQAFPESWLIIDSGLVPVVEQVVRFVGARIADDRTPAMIYVDRLGTTVWTADA